MMRSLTVEVAALQQLDQVVDGIIRLVNHQTGQEALQQGPHTHQAVVSWCVCVRTCVCARMCVCIPAAAGRCCVCPGRGTSEGESSAAAPSHPSGEGGNGFFS